MQVIYEVILNSTGIQVTRDSLFGWMVRGKEPESSWEVLSLLNGKSLAYLSGLTFPAHIPEEFKEALKNLSYVSVSSTGDTGPNKLRLETPYRMHDKLTVGALICDRLTYEREGDFYVADLKYCHVKRHGDIWTVIHMDGLSTIYGSDRVKSSEFTASADAIDYIVKHWW